MTRDAFYKAQELNDELTAIDAITDIISNSTLSGSDEDRAHDEHVREDKMLLCYMSHDDIESYNNVDITADRLGGQFQYIGKYRLGGRIFGKDIPIGLVKVLEQAIHDYREKIEKEFDALSDDYESED